MQASLSIRPDGKSIFVSELERLLEESGFKLLNKQFPKRTFPQKKAYLYPLPRGTQIAVKKRYFDDLMSILDKYEIPVYSYHSRFSRNFLPGKFTVNVATPTRYFVDGVDERKESELADKVRFAVDNVNSDISLKDSFFKYSNELSNYPKKVMPEPGGIPISKQLQTKFDRLTETYGRIIRNEPDGNDAIEVALNDTFNSFDIDVVSTSDGYKGVKKAARDSGICWTDGEYEPLAKELFEDFSKSGGTIIYTISLDKKKIGFGRSFVGFDKQGDTHLFIDLIEGIYIRLCRNYYHDAGSWVDEWYAGGLKAGILFNIYLAKKAGIDYVTAGDIAPSFVFKELGGQRKKVLLKTKEGLRFYKLGKIDYTDADMTSRNVVKSYYTDSEKAYSLDMKNFSK